MDFLTEKDDLIVDPFAGSNTTGEVAELLERRWISIERDNDYAQDSRFRFANLTPQHRASDTPPQPL